MNKKPLVEISFDDSIIPKNSGNWYFEVGYRVPRSWVKSIKDGEIVFSEPIAAKMNLFSRWFRTCLGIAGINEAGGKVLSHMCPGGYYPSTKKKFSISYLREYEGDIEDALRMWRDECGIDNDHAGMFGSCVFPENKQEWSLAYLEAVKWMGDKMAKILTGDPQILGLPSRGYNEQHISVTDRIHIVRRPSFTLNQANNTGISLDKIGSLVSAMMK